MSGRTQGGQDARFIRMRALRTVLAKLEHGVGQQRDAGDEARVQLVAVDAI